MFSYAFSTIQRPPFPSKVGEGGRKGKEEERGGEKGVRNRKGGRKG